MSLDLLTEIEEAEAKAETIKQEAIAEAREMIKAAEEAILAVERDAAKEIREDAAGVVGEAEVGARDQIRALEIRKVSERKLLTDSGIGRVERAGAYIFERVVDHGDR